MSYKITNEKLWVAMGEKSKIHKGIKIKEKLSYKNGDGRKW